MGVLLSLFLFSIWSTVFPIGKWLVGFSTPVFLTGIRMLFAGVLLIGFLLIRNRKALKINKKQLLSISLLALLSIYLTNVLEFYGLQHLSAAKTCFIYSLSPFLTALFSFIHFKEKMNKTKWIGMIIGFSGVLPVLFIQNQSGDLLSLFKFVALPEIAVMGAVILSVYGWVLLRMVVKNDEVPPTTANGLSMLIGGAMALGHSFLFEAWNPLPIVAGGIGPVIKGTVILTLLSNVICYNLYGHLLKRFTATLMSFFGLLSPIFASLTGWLILGEPPSLTIMLSTCIVLIGLYFVYRSELKQGYIYSSTPIDA